MQAQFFPDLKDFCVTAADTHRKAVIVAGLDGDFRRESFGQVSTVARSPRGGDALTCVRSPDPVTGAACGHGDQEGGPLPALPASVALLVAHSGGCVAPSPAAVHLRSHPPLNRHAHRAGRRQRGLPSRMSHVLQRIARGARQRCCAAAGGAIAAPASCMRVLLRRPPPRARTNHLTHLSTSVPTGFRLQRCVVMSSAPSGGWFAGVVSGVLSGDSVTVVGKAAHEARALRRALGCAAPTLTLLRRARRRLRRRSRWLASSRPDWCGAAVRSASQVTVAAPPLPSVAVRALAADARPRTGSPRHR